MRNFLLHFVRAALLVSVGVLVFSTLVSQATAATPPSECSKQKFENNSNIYSCTQGFPPKNCGEQSPGVYKCPESKMLVQIFDESSSDAGNCTNTCIGAKGIVLYSNTSDFYCYGAQDSKICKYGSAEINIKTGAQKELTEECDITSWGCWVRKLLLAFKNIPVLIPALFPFITFYLVSSAISAIALGLSKAVLWFAVAAMNVSVTPALNQFVADGFAISQQLANLFFLLIFVFIGLATILRIPSYEIKKMLPRLVVVVLLINFSGVLVGLVVDIGNLFTNFFLSRALSFDAFGAMQSCVLDIGKNIDKYVFASTYSQLFSMMGIAFSQLFVMAIFSTLLLLVMIVVGVVFLARLVALWIAAILAPLAFASSVLPGTRAFFNQWLDGLIKWAVIGIPIGFFMYLASLLLSSASMADNAGCNMAAGKLLPDAPPTDNPLMMFIVGQIPLLAALLILWEGIKMSQKFAPAAAQSAISLGKTIGLGAAGFVGGAALMRTKAALATSQPWQNAMNQIATTRAPNILGGSFVRWAGRSMGQGLVDSQKQAVGASDKSAAGKSMTTQASLFRSASNDAARIGIIQAMANDQNLDGAIADGHVTPAEINQLFGSAAAYGTTGGLRNALPHTAATIPAITTPDAATIVRAGTLGPTGAGLVSAQMLDVFQRIRPSNYKSMSNQVLRSPEFLNTLILAGTGSHLHEFIDRFGLAGRDEIQARLNALSGGGSTRAYLQTHNRPLANYINRGAGTGVGVTLT